MPHQPQAKKLATVSRSPHPWYNPTSSDHCLSAEATPSFDCSKRRDANWERIKNYGSIVNPIVWKYLEPTDREAPPRTYIHLIRVATSPKWQRHGAGTLLVNWGIKLTQNLSLRIGLLATPSGHGLYAKLGFKDIKTTYVRQPHDDESASMEAMLWYSKEEGILGQVAGSIHKFGMTLGQLCNIL